jgi:hypothetical protein
MPRLGDSTNEKCCESGPLLDLASVSRLTSLRILQRIQQHPQRIKVGGFGEMEIEARGLRALAILGLAPAC